jgi:hypothetical protein
MRLHDHESVRNWPIATERTCATARPVSVAQRKKFDARVVLNRAKMTGADSMGRVLRMSAPLAHHQCAFRTASTDVTPAIIEPVIATSAGTPRGNSRLISEAMKIAAMGRATTK